MQTPNLSRLRRLAPAILAAALLGPAPARAEPDFTDLKRKLAYEAMQTGDPAVTGAVSTLVKGAFFPTLVATIRGDGDPAGGDGDPAPDPGEIEHWVKTRALKEIELERAEYRLIIVARLAPGCRKMSEDLTMSRGAPEGGFLAGHWVRVSAITEYTVHECENPRSEGATFRQPLTVNLEISRQEAKELRAGGA